MNDGSETKKRTDENSNSNRKKSIKVETRTAKRGIESRRKDCITRRVHKEQEPQTRIGFSLLAV